MPKSWQTLLEQFATLKRPADLGPAGTRKRFRSVNKNERFDFSEKEYKFLSHLFSADYYASIAGLDKEQPSGSLLEHYIQLGLPGGLSPSPLFDASLVDKLLPPEITDNRPPLIRWLKSNTRAFTPTPHFDEEFYLGLYHDVRMSGVSAFEHFIFHGKNEARKPNILFDYNWYHSVRASINADNGLAPYLHYLVHALPKGVPPRESLRGLFELLVDKGGNPNTFLPTVATIARVFIEKEGLGRFDTLCEIAPLYLAREQNSESIHRVDIVTYFERFLATETSPVDLDESEVKLLRRIFVSHENNRNGSKNAFADYLLSGLMAGSCPSPLFSNAVVDKILPRSEGDDRPAVLRWLKSPQRMRIVPTLLFDEMNYTKTYPDIDASIVSPYEHFIVYGIYERRVANGFFDAAWYESVRPEVHPDKSLPSYLHYLVHALPKGVPPRESLRGLFDFLIDTGADPKTLLPRLASIAHTFIEKEGLGRFDILCEIAPVYLARPLSANGESMDHTDPVAAFERFLTIETSPVDLDERELKLLRKMFVPHEDNRSNDGDKKNAFAEYLIDGLMAGLPPSPLFSNAVIDELLQRSEDDGSPAVLRWLKSPQRMRIVPTLLFDEIYYTTLYPDIDASIVSPYEHFIVYGTFEGRAANALFDAAWYDSVRAHVHPDKTLPSYLHYLRYALPKGFAPRASLTAVFSQAPDARPAFQTRLEDLVASTKHWLNRFDIFKLDILIALFLSSSYKKREGVPQSLDAIELLIDFLDRGAEEGVDPGPFFDSNAYEVAARDAGHTPDKNATPIIDFLSSGIHKRIVPTRLFDESAYRKKYPDIASSPLWGFEHFILFGIFEGRAIDEENRLALAASVEPWPTGPLTRWFRFWLLHEDVATKNTYLVSVAAAQKQMSAVIRSKLFAEIVGRAQTIEPAIGDVDEVNEFLVAPFHDQRDVVRREMIKRLPRPDYDTIICIPWLRVGGADLVACLFGDALLKIRPNEKVLLLQTDHSNFERPDWIPESADRVDISDLLNRVSLRDAEFLLFNVIVGLCPKRLLNVNSLRCWRVLERFGVRMRPLMALYSYFFCWDQTASGRKVGYPNDFFASTAGILSFTFTDTTFLREELLRIYRVPAEICSRVATLHSPPRVDVEHPLAAETGLRCRETRPRPLVLWAGRLDRQKRFDIVQDVAKALPYVDFWCWGSPLLDQGPDLSQSPANLTLNRPFASFDDLPLGQSDLWLYTSAWEGMPTVLIELAGRGVAIVASAVGGIPELIDEETGWPVHDIDDIFAYVLAIQESLANPKQRVERARRLQQKARSKYSRENFKREVAEILEYEVRG